MSKDFNTWNQEKQKLHLSCREDEIYVHERDIWWCSLGVNIGDEEDGKNDRFERPALVLKKFNKKIVLVVPLTTKSKDNKYYFSFVHEGVVFAAMISQMRLLSTKRFSRRIRKINADLFKRIKEEIVRVAL